jgi:glycosyltransferase involved in cell wall biosynthesis
VICTHNRARDLDNALDSIANQDEPEFPWEAIVVDNASTDDTASVAARWNDDIPLRLVREPVLGLCHARNAGWKSAAGAVVAYLDDDAIAERSWLTEIGCRFGEGDERLGCIGGRVDPIWEAPRPGWLSDQLALGLTILNWSDRPKPITDIRREWLVGTNIAFRREALVAAGGFHPALDRSGSHMLSGGDTYLTKHLLALGYTCEFLPAMRVRHRVPRERLTQEWFRRRYFWQGVSDAVMELLDSKPALPARLSRGLQRAGRLGARPGRLARAFTRTEDPAAFESQCWTLIELGHVARLLGVS